MGGAALVSCAPTCVDHSPYFGRVGMRNLRFDHPSCSCTEAPPNFGDTVSHVASCGVPHGSLILIRLHELGRVPEAGETRRRHRRCDRSTAERERLGMVVPLRGRSGS